MVDWLEAHSGLVAGLFVASVVMFVLSVVIVPWWAARLPADYFAHRTRPRGVFDSEHPVLKVVLSVARNVLAAVLLVGGVAMLVLPGQGLLTIFIAFVLADAPGKYRLEKWLVRRRAVRRPLNWLRRRAGREALVIERRDEQGHG